MVIFAIWVSSARIVSASVFACDSLSDDQKVAVLGGTAAKLLNMAG